MARVCYMCKECELCHLSFKKGTVDFIPTDCPFGSEGKAKWKRVHDKEKK